MKTILAAGALLALSTPAYAGSAYLNVENNALWQGSEYSAALTEVHAGYEWDNGIYFQGGPAFVAVDGEETRGEYSAKLGVVGDLSDQLEVYAEVAALTEHKDFSFDELDVATQLGLTFRF